MKLEIIPQSSQCFFTYQEKIIRDGYDYADNWLIRKSVLIDGDRVDNEIISKLTFEDRARIDKLINSMASDVILHDAPDDNETEFTIINSNDFTLKDSGYRIKKLDIPGSLYPVFKAKTQREGIAKASKWIIPYCFLVNNEYLMIEGKQTEFYKTLIENDVDNGGFGFGGGLLLFQRVIAPFF